ncbi:CRISPR-associated endoribonuclease Cas6, partial [Peptostreptococcaceae bacterium OttesenSCG-928-C18]|nr:CRISPR-associated endoribonuclease Cas6 [Peptostreptococcaceae bacterium OttesenSCG-928-C18]
NKERSAILKLILEFKLKEQNMPLEYRKVFMHFIKVCLNNANDGKYFDYFYEDTKAKNFAFSMFFDKPIYKKSGIELASNRLKVIFTVYEKMEGLILYNSFLENRGKEVLFSEGSNYMQLNKVTKINEPEVYGNKVLIKMNSPLLVRKHDRESNLDKYYCYDNAKFKEELESNIKRQLQRQGFSKEFVEGVQVVPVKCKKVVVKHYGCKLDGNLGNFIIEGNSLILNYLLKAGIGSRHSEGFGQAEFIEEVL